MLNYSQLLELKRWNTPTIYNGWAQYTSHSITSHFNRETVTDYMPELGPMVGYAVTVVFEPSEKAHQENKQAWTDYRRYMASLPGPKIVVVQDLDKPQTCGAIWGEVTANYHRALGCVGTITDGAIRDLDEMKNAGFKALARKLCIGKGYSTPVRWGCEVEVFGCKIQPGQLIHADKHGFLAVPPEDEAKLLGAAVFMDQNECQTLIPTVRDTAGKSTEEILEALATAGAQFRANTDAHFAK